MRTSLPAILSGFLVALFGVSVFAQDFDDEDRRPLGGLGAVEPYDLRTEYLADPVGIDALKPRFTWKLKSEVQGQFQSAFKIELYRIVDHKEQQLVWSTDIAPGPSQAVEYAGKPLEPASHYAWFLTVWDKPSRGKFVLADPDVEKLREKTDAADAQQKSRGKPSATVFATFSTGLFPTEAEPNPWKGKWIGLEPTGDATAAFTLDGAKWIAATKPGENFALPTGKSVFRKTFDLPEDVKTLAAHAVFAGDNSYRTFINGAEVQGGTNYKTANPADILKQLKPGRNVVAVEVDNAGSEPNPAGLLGVVRIDVEPGTLSLNIPTDASWKAAEGSPENFSATDCDDSAWAAATVQCAFGEGPWGDIQVGKPGLPPLPARYFLKDFEPGDPKEIVRATISICGLGYYEVLLNGKKVGDHLLDPVLTDYDKRVPYVTYELNPKSLPNVTHITKTESQPVPTRIGVILGNGRYYAPRSTEPTATRTFGYPKMLFQLDIRYKNGEKKTIVSDETWEVTDEGPIRENNDYDGEVYDARMDDFQNVTWKPAQVVAAPKGKVVAQMMPPMRAVEEFEPVSVTEVRPGVWVYDFGVNLVGNCFLNLSHLGIPAGTTITLRHAESLETEGPDKGMLYTANLRDAKCRDIYITGAAHFNTRYIALGGWAGTLSGGGPGDRYQPMFTYHGFRYAEITGLPKGCKPDAKTLVARAINTDLKRVSRFETSNETINAVYRNVVRGTQGNYLSIPTDCPQRDERQGWQGDRAGEAKGEMFLFDNATLYRKWMIDIEDSQTDEGNLSDVCPNFWPLYNPNVTWPSAFTFIPGSIETMYGDSRSIAQHYPAMKRWLIDYLGQFVKDGIIDKDNYGDWCVPPEEKHLVHSKDPKRQTSKTLLATAYYIYNLKLLAQYALMLDKPEDAKAFTAQAEEMTAAFNKRFYDPATGKYDNGTQTSCVLPLYFGLVPEGQREKVFKVLVENIENVTNKHIGTGLIGGQWLNRVLTEGGRGDLALAFATNRTYPSWGYMVDQGATTIWELWNGNTADPSMNSHNHVMLVGDLVIWYFEKLAGIAADPDRPGFEHIIMKPFVPTGPNKLSFVDAEFDSPRGPIVSYWEIARDEFDGKTKFIWLIDVPCGATASAYVPTSNPESVTVDVPVDRAEDGAYVLPCGSYRIEAEWK